MAVMDEFKEEREKLKGAPFGKKVSYFFYYYKWFVIIGIVVILAVVYTITTFAKRGHTLVRGAVVNGYMTGDVANIEAGFVEYLGADPKKSNIDFEDSLYIDASGGLYSSETAQLLMVYSAAGTMDYYVMDPAYFIHYSYEAVLADLRLFISEDLLNEYADSVVYVDMKEVYAYQELEDSGADTRGFVNTDPHKPEEMEEPVPIGFDISTNTIWTNEYSYAEGMCYIGISSTGDSREMAAKFIEYLLTQGTPEK